MSRRPVPRASTARPLVSPLHQSVVYATETPDSLDSIYEGAPGFTYSREGHPNAHTVASMIDEMEGVSGGTMTSSGMAAVSLALLATVSAGDHVLGSTQLYGRSLRLMTEELPRLGIATSLFDSTDIRAARAAVTPQTKVILVEVVSNPTLRVADMEGLAELAREHGVKLIVDNTFTTPLGYQPFQHGADIVLHSVTKLLSGHSDVMAGWVASQDEETNARMDMLAATWGSSAAPFDCWLAERGLLSFPLRFERAQSNAARLADALAETEGVARVLYPTRPDHPDHNRALQLLNGAGGNMVSFDVGGTRARANALTQAADLAFAPTLGDITTTLSHPASSSHRALSPEEREALGMGEGFFRVSVGVEPVERLIETLTNAVNSAVQCK